MPAPGTGSSTLSVFELDIPDCPLCGCGDARHLFTARDRLIGRLGEFPVVQCARCALVYLRLRPAVEHLGAYYPETYYPLDDRQASPEALEVATGLLNRVRAWTSGQTIDRPRILDVGCGTGLFLKLARDEGFEVHGVEFSQPAVDYARTVYDLPIQRGELAEARLAPETFDVVTMWHVLEHLLDPVETLREIRKLLKPGGLLLFGVPNIASWEARFFGRRWFSLDAPRHLMHFSPATTSRLLASAGFSLERIVHSDGTAGLVYSIMGDLTGISLRLRDQELSDETYRRFVWVLGWVARPVCSLAARLERGGAIEVYARKPRG